MAANRYLGSLRSAKNARERGLPFELAGELEWQRAVVFVDDRFMYGEERLIAFAPMRGRLYAVCYVQRGQVRQIAFVGLSETDARGATLCQSDR